MSITQRERRCWRYSLIPIISHEFILESVYVNRTMYRGILCHLQEVYLLKMPSSSRFWKLVVALWQCAICLVSFETEVSDQGWYHSDSTISKLSISSHCLLSSLMLWNKCSHPINTAPFIIFYFSFYCIFFKSVIQFWRRGIPFQD